MNIMEQFTSGFVRKLGYMAAALVLAAVLSLLGVGKANAAQVTLSPPPGCTGNYPTQSMVCDDQTKATHYATAVATAECNAIVDSGPYSCVNPTYQKLVSPRPNDPYAGSVRFKYQMRENPPRTVHFTRETAYVYFYPCPTGTEWNQDLDGCDPPCLSRNAGLGGVNQPIKFADSPAMQCNGGCKYEIVSDNVTKAMSVATPGQTAVQMGTLYGGKWEYTGDRCTVTPPKPKDDEKPKLQCVSAPSGQTYCEKPNGDHCATATNGRTFCWKPGEEGKKTDGPITQERKAGEQPPTPPPGSETTHQTTINNTSNNTSTTTTISNYTTTNGQPAGPSNQGEPAGPDGKPTGGGDNGSGGGGGGGDGEGNESGGGGSCGDPPVSSGDAILAQIARQAWETRCAITDRNEEQDQQVANMSTDDGTGSINESDIFAPEGDGTIAINEGLISGGGGGMCSLGSLSLMGEPIEIPAPFWDLAGWISTLMIGLAYLWVAQKLGS